MSLHHEARCTEESVVTMKCITATDPHHCADLRQQDAASILSSSPAMVCSGLHACQPFEAGCAPNRQHPARRGGPPRVERLCGLRVVPLSKALISRCGHDPLHPPRPYSPADASLEILNEAERVTTRRHEYGDRSAVCLACNIDLPATCSCATSPTAAWPVCSALDVVDTSPDAISAEQGVHKHSEGKAEPRSH